MPEGAPNGAVATEPFAWVENSAAGSARPGAALRELWGSRELVGFFALRDIKVRYKQALFGMLWAVLQPIAGTAVIAVAFHELGHIRNTGLPYLPSTLLAYAAWSYLSSTTLRMNSAFIDNAPLVTKVYFPRLAIPVGVTLPGLLDLAGGLVALVGFMIGYGVSPGPGLATFPLCVLALMGCSYGVGVILGTLNVQFRDVGQIIGLGVQLWFFLSPVAYQSNLVKGTWAWPYHLNPMAGILDTLRWGVLSGPPPHADDLVSLGTLLTVVLVATWYFVRVERRLADII